MKDRESAQKLNRGSLRLAFCNDCGFIYNQDFEPSKLSYDERYDNSQTYSPSFEEYLSGLVCYLVLEKNVRDCHIVEVGCGKGWFLRRLVEFEGANNTGCGFDSSYEGPAVDLGGRLKFEKKCYGSEHAEIPADVVICRHVIEHVQDPLNLLQTIREAVNNSPHARIFFETPCVEWVLRNRIIWDFFYEHCSYFTADSLKTAFEVSGFRVEGIQRIFGGQYLLLEATISSEKPNAAKSSGPIPDLAMRFAESEGALIHSLREEVQKLNFKGRVAIWGAGAKGVTFANQVDPECRLIRCIVDLNPRKQGHYLPGTGHPIVSYEELPKYEVTAAILMNPNYRHESYALLSKSHIAVDLIDLTEWLEHYEAY